MGPEKQIRRRILQGDGGDPEVIRRERAGRGVGRERPPELQGKAGAEKSDLPDLGTETSVALFRQIGEDIVDLSFQQRGKETNTKKGLEYFYRRQPPKR